MPHQDGCELELGSTASHGQVETSNPSATGHRFDIRRAIGDGWDDPTHRRPRNRGPAPSSRRRTRPYLSHTEIGYEALLQEYGPAIEATLASFNYAGAKRKEFSRLYTRISHRLVVRYLRPVLTKEREQVGILSDFEKVDRPLAGCVHLLVRFD